MTKNEVIADFKQNFPLTLKSNDKAAIREDWNNLVDLLQKSGKVTKKQANNWVNPFLSKKDR